KPDWQTIAVRVVAVEALGAENVLIGQIAGQATGTADAHPAGGDKPLEIAARLSRYFTAPVGSIVELYIDPLPMHLFDPETELVIARPSLMRAAQ
ncbi:glycerol-3-phosphate ABC transporter ATP-binding protein, partial [Mesorhizobium sp. M7A.T.Ca.TU.009.01.3.1]